MEKAERRHAHIREGLLTQVLLPPCLGYGGKLLLRQQYEYISQKYRYSSDETRPSLLVDMSTCTPYSNTLREYKSIYVFLVRQFNKSIFLIILETIELKII